MDKTDIAERMKNYEAIPKNKLMRRTPVAIRIDGRAFHTFTKGFQKPFDEVLIKTMQETMKYLCENIQGCVLGYTQSDEITLILTDYGTLETDAWFDYEVQKLCSISASMATMAFNRFFKIEAGKVMRIAHPCKISESYREYVDTLSRAAAKGAMFDARCFNIPKEEVTNLIYWRQLDAMRNSVQMVGQANFSHKELQNKSCNNIKEMLLEQKNFNWDHMMPHLQRGCCCIKKKIDTHSQWDIDIDIPIFKGDDRQYIEKLI